LASGCELKIVVVVLRAVPINVSKTITTRGALGTPATRALVQTAVGY
jgi:hypothetical protein